MPLNEKLRPFLKLQEIDSERFRLRKAIDAAEARKEAPKKAVVSARNAVASSDLVRIAKEKLLADAQLKLKVEEERLQKLEKQILTLSSGREYKTMEHQIKGKKADKSLIEDEILHVMEEADASRKTAADAKTALDKAEGAAKTVEDAVLAATREARDRLAVLDREAGVAEKLCDPEILGAYQTLLGRRNGLAITTIANRICQGCYTSITAHEENKLLGGQLITCSNCQRFVYLP
jgi:predicted  nucleic acid-binding Zn-ribbon protein